MSLVSDFVQSMANQAFTLIGAEPVVIGATTISCILAEVEDGKDFATGGFEISKRLTATCRTSAMPVAPILKKVATARGESFRVEGVRKGGDFTTIDLTEIQKS